MRAISLYQPFASAIALGLKRYETRSWPTAYRGPLLIHAGTHWTRFEQAALRSALVRLSSLCAERTAYFGVHARNRGAIVAVVDLVEMRPTDQGIPGLTDELERFFGDFRPGRWAWQLENVVRLPEPIPCKGRQGLWVPDSSICDLVQEAVT